MRSLLISIFCFMAYCANAQLVNEHIYPGGGNGRLVLLSNAGYKYLVCDDVNKEIRLYNTDHSLYKTMNVPQYTGYFNFVYPNWVSDRLFNNDTLVEYTMNYYGQPDKYEVINEDGQVLNSVLGSDYGDVYKDGNDAFKLILRSYSDGKVYVYSLPGFLPCDGCSAGE